MLVTLLTTDAYILVALAKRKTNQPAENLQIAKVDSTDVLHHSNYKQINHFEDGMEHNVAVHDKCTLLITEDKNDLYFSTIEIVNYRDFSVKYVV